MTYRISAGGVAGELERLAAAPAEVDLTPEAALAGLRHPVRPAETLEERRFRPDPRQGVLAHVRAREGERVRGGAGQGIAVGRDGELSLSPPAHAGLGVLAVVVGEDIDDVHPSLQAHTGSAHDRLRPLELCLAGQERGAVAPRPAV